MGIPWAEAWFMPPIVSETTTSTHYPSTSRVEPIINICPGLVNDLLLKIKSNTLNSIYKQNVS